MRRVLQAGVPSLELDALQLRFLLAAVAASAVIGDLTAKPSSLRIAILAVAACAVIGLGFLNPRALLLTLVVWLALLGLLRRLVSLSAGSTGTDPLLLIGPLAFAALLLIAAQLGAFSRLSTLAKGVLALNMLTLLGAFNPLQASVSAGVAGLLFVLVPTLAFWIARGLVDDVALKRVFLLTAGLAVAAAVYGLWQTFAGLPSWDARWVASSNFAALNIDRTVRPFGTFSSAAEYGFYLAIGIVIFVSFARSLTGVVFAFAAVALLGTALLYESSRTTVVLLAAALGIAIAARRGVRPLTALVVGAAGVLLISTAAGHFAHPSSGGATSALVSHETQGLADPFNSESSTALGHVSLVLNGIRSAFSNPVGHGVSAVTIAGSKFGGVNQNTEADPSNAAVALGLPGLLAYLVVLVAGIGLVYRNAARRRDALANAGLAVVIATTLEWLNGGQYAVAFLPWLVLGWADRPAVQDPEPSVAEVDESP